ncbi:MAG: hypothetical protein WBD20_02810 [Pirellulaceae bacterium]
MTKPPANQFTIAGMFMVTAAVAAVLGLSRLWSDGGGLYLAIPAASIPFAFVVEFAFLNRPSDRSIPKLTVISGRLAVIILLSALPALAAYVSVINQSSWWSPIPFLVFLPYMYLDLWLIDYPYSVFAIPSIVLFVLVAPSAFSKACSSLPIRSKAMLCIATCTSAYWFAFSINAAFEYQSAYYLYSCITVNLLAIMVLSVSWFLRRGRFGFSSILAWNLALVCWLFWLAHPWLGEYT